MAKYSKEFKLKVVKYCIENYHTSYEAAKKFNIPSPTPIKHWIGKYNEHGEIGIEKNNKASNLNSCLNSSITITFSIVLALFFSELRLAIFLSMHFPF